MRRKRLMVAAMTAALAAVALSPQFVSAAGWCRACA